MNKKIYIWLAVGAVFVIVAVYILVLLSNPNTSLDLPADVKNPNKSSLVPANNGQPAAEERASKTAREEAPAKENVISVDGKEFSPRNIDAAPGSKIFMTFSAKDSKKHTLSFEAEDLAFITVSFSKEEGDKSINFPAPQPGMYYFYVDTKDNRGTLTIK